MAPYCLRVDDCFPDVCGWLSGKSFGGWAVHETVDGANPHWHFVIYCDIAIKNLRNGLLRAVPGLSGNGRYSLTECRDEQKYLRYMAKGESEGQAPEVAWSHIVDVDIEKLHDEYWTENRRLKKRKAGSMIDWVVDEAKRQNVSYGNRDALARLYIRELGARGKSFSLFQVKATLNAVQLALCPDDTILEQLVGSVSQF